MVFLNLNCYTVTPIQFALEIHSKDSGLVTLRQRGNVSQLQKQYFSNRQQQITYYQ